VLVGSSNTVHTAPLRARYRCVSTAHRLTHGAAARCASLRCSKGPSPAGALTRSVLCASVSRRSAERLRTRGPPRPFLQLLRGGRVPMPVLPHVQAPPQLTQCPVHALSTLCCMQCTPLTSPVHALSTLCCMQCTPLFSPVGAVLCVVQVRGRSATGRGQRRYTRRWGRATIRGCVQGRALPRAGKLRDGTEAAAASHSAPHSAQCNDVQMSTHHPLHT
jgi:hypothetical protein